MIADAGTNSVALFPAASPTITSNGGESAAVITLVTGDASVTRVVVVAAPPTTSFSRL